jgi:2-dehydropantoate 2-reductase
VKVCVYGCGAIGGLLAARLAQSGVAVSVVARGEHLRAIQRQGLTLRSGDDEKTVYVDAVENPSGLGQQDFVLLTMKSHTVQSVAPKIFPLLKTGTAVVTAANGIPWWYFHGLGDELGTPELRSVDPGQQLWLNVGPENAVGCVVYPAARIDEPGVVRHMFGDQFSIGEPDGSKSTRLVALSGLLKAAGFEPLIQNNIRVDIWTKLVANTAFNPVSVMTGKPLGAMLEDEATARLLEQIMLESVEVASAYGIEVAMSPAQLLDATKALGDHKTSMLHDFEAGRSLELEPIVGAVIELAGFKGISVPNLTMVRDLVRTRAADR